jgi:hypothetical protein
MIHKLHFPPPPLSRFVENIWLVEGFAADYTREKILPDGAIELIIDLDPQPEVRTTCLSGWLCLKSV